MYTRKENSDDAAISQLNQAKIAVEVSLNIGNLRDLEAYARDRCPHCIALGPGGALSDRPVVERF